MPTLPRDSTFALSNSLGVVITVLLMVAPRD